MQPSPSTRIALIPGCLGAVGPLAIDMYLPGLPAIATDLQVGEAAMQFSLMAFFAGLMIGQLFYGPLSDRTGRKPMIHVGLALFVAASLGCATAATAGQLIAWRFAQGLGGSIGMVIGLAIIRDLYTGHTAARLMALMMIVLSVAPVMAPLLGTAIMAIAPRPALFGVLALFGAASALLVAPVLPETRSEELRIASRPLDAVRNYLRLTVSRRHIPHVAATAFAQAGFFAYLAGLPFVFISLHGRSAATYSLIFAANAIGLMAGAQTAPRLMPRFGPQTIVRGALAVHLIAALLLAGLELFGGAGLVPLSVLLFFIITSVSFVMPLKGMMALDSHGAIAGTAAALMGALQFGTGAIASFLVGLTANGTALPMILIIAFGGIAACLVAFKAFPDPQTALLQEEQT